VQAVDALPAGCVSEWNSIDLVEIGPGSECGSMILPQLERTRTFSSVDFNLAINGPTNTTSAATPLADFRCPYPNYVAISARVRRSHW
jgi:hypothetical protein